MHGTGGLVFSEITQTHKIKHPYSDSLVNARKLVACKNVVEKESTETGKGGEERGREKSDKGIKTMLDRTCSGFL